MTSTTLGSFRSTNENYIAGKFTRCSEEVEYDEKRADDGKYEVLRPDHVIT